jgi:GT2 family glycosyltransferase
MNLVSTATASIVVYNNDFDEVSKLLDSLILSQLKTIFLIDNSPNDDLKILKTSDKIEYIHSPSNLGFGAGHNIAISKSLDLGTNYHFIINPDIYFTEDVIRKMVEYVEKDPQIGMMMPQILNLDGSVQNLPKLLPNLWSIIFRKLKKPRKLYLKFINKYELQFVQKDKIYNAPILSGCFTLLNLKVIKKVGLYDDKYFMYFEDWDLSRRVHKYYKTIYFPIVSVYHGYESGANRSLRLFKIFINSGITYFNKWGWFFDSERKKINKEALSQFK